LKSPEVHDLLAIREHELITTKLQLGEMHQKMHEVNLKLVEVQVSHGSKLQYLELNIETLESKNAQLQLLLDTALNPHRDEFWFIKLISLVDK
jgi:hypothetical protein